MSGLDELMLTKTQMNKLKRAKSQGVGADTKMSKTQIRKAIKQGGSLLSSLISLGTRALASKLFGRGLSTLTSGGQGLSTLRKPIGGKGLSRKPGYLMPYQPPPFFGTWEDPVGSGMSEKKTSFTLRNNLVKPQFKIYHYPT